mmetsp:Transcript_23353/g.39086  ORF Transcript_23353/g.39086 Transcript_23353/m.39086 type:complete len:95 (-) Transcript_23353:37-321(-)
MSDYRAIFSPQSCKHVSTHIYNRTGTIIPSGHQARCKLVAIYRHGGNGVKTTMRQVPPSAPHGIQATTIAFHVFVVTIYTIGCPICSIFTAVGA